MVNVKSEKTNLDDLIFYFYTNLQGIAKEKKRNNNRKETEITESQLRYLKAIDKLRIPTMSELTKEMGYSKASVSISIKNLEKKGFIKKRRSGTDKRSYYLIITGKGVNSVKSQRDVFKDYTNYIKEQLSDQEQNELKELLKKIIPLRNL